MRNESRLRLPNVAVNQNPNLRLWCPAVGCGNILPPCPV